MSACEAFADYLRCQAEIDPASRTAEVRHMSVEVFSGTSLFSKGLLRYYVRGDCFVDLGWCWSVEGGREEEFGEEREAELASSRHH